MMTELLTSAQMRASEQAAFESGAASGLELMESQLSKERFLAGPDFTVADITAIMPFTILERIGIDIPDHCPSVRRWRDEVFARPSVAAILNPPQAA